MRIRFSAAAQASSSWSGVLSGKTSWARIRSISGRRRRRPRTISPWTSASLASRSIGLLPGAAACEQLFPRDPRALGFDLRPQGRGLLLPSLQIGPHFVAMPKVVGDDRVDIGQTQRIIGADHVFRGHAILVLLDDQVEADAALADTHGAPFVHPKRGAVGVDGKCRFNFLQNHSRNQDQLSGCRFAKLVVNVCYHDLRAAGHRYDNLADARERRAPGLELLVRHFLALWSKVDKVDRHW